MQEDFRQMNEENFIQMYQKIDTVVPMRVLKKSLGK